MDGLQHLLMNLVLRVIDKERDMMFENKWKDRCNELEIQVRELTQQIVDISKTNKSVTVVKLIPNNSEQFELDGEFVVDPSKAVYGSHPLTFSEAVLFKAGKETATREYAHQIEELKSANALLESTIEGYKQQIEDSQSIINAANSAEFKTRAELSELTANYNDKLNELQDTFKAESAELRRTISELRDKIKQLESSVHKWKDRANRTPDLVYEGIPIITPCGTIC